MGEAQGPVIKVVRVDMGLRDPSLKPSVGWGLRDLRSRPSVGDRHQEP